MKKIKIIVLLVALLLIGCGQQTQHNVYDDDKQIEGEGNSFSLRNYNQNKNGDRLYVNVGFMDGMDTIWEYDANSESTVDIGYDLKLTSGKVPLCAAAAGGAERPGFRECAALLLFLAQDRGLPAGDA